MGDTASIYYDDRLTNNAGTDDYATITDFNPLEDKVQLRGLASNYRLEISGSNTNLFFDKDGSEPDELIGVFQNQTGLNLTSSAFEYVAPIVVTPTSTVAFSSGSYSVNEDGIAQVTVLRSGNISGQTSLTVFLSNGTATAPSDYSNAPIPVTFNAGETSKTVTIPIVDDTNFEPNETINLALTNLSNDTNLGTQNTAVFTIIDNDVVKPGAIAFTSSNFSINENGSVVQAITLTRTGGSDGIVGITVTPSNGTAIAPDDYNSNPITVSFANGEISKSVFIPIDNDTIFETNETVNLTLSNPTGGATLGTQTSAILTIVDNDSPQQGSLAFSNPTYTVNEDGTLIGTAITVTRTGGSDLEVSATINLSNGSATAPEDYNNSPITVTFANGDATPKIITIPIVNDTLVESTETINLTLTNPSGGAILGSQNTAVLGIVDDDIQLNFSTSNYTVREDGTAVTDIIITRSGKSTGAVSTTITFTDGTATGCGCAASSVNNDFFNGSFTVTLADGETSKVLTVENASLGGSNAIRIRNDVKVEGDETFTINLTNPTSGATIGDRGTATVKILDDDVELAFSAANFSVKENGEAIAAVNVTRNGRLTGAVGATINLTDGTATAPSDYNNTPIVVAFADGETSKTIFIPVINDITVEPDETVNLSLIDPTGGAVLGTQNTAVLKIVDNGQAPTLGVSINKDIIAESSGNAAAIGTVTRNVITNEDLVVTLVSSDTTEATVPTQVTILAQQASATFNINAVDDGIADGAQPVIITASATGFSSGSRNLTVTDINVPDLVISNLSATTPLLTGKQAFFSYKLENKGLATASTTDENPSLDRVYLSTDNKLDSADTLLGEFPFKGNFPVGQFLERNVAFFVPRTIGQYYLIAQTDATNVVNEGGSIGDNNNTTITPVTVAAAYRAIASTDTEVGLAGQSVILKGQALSNLDNSPIAFEFVTVAVKNNGTVRELSAFTDVNGNFTSTFRPLANEGGQYQVNAYFPNNPTEDAAPEDSFKLLGMRFATNSVSNNVIANQTFTGQVSLQNLTDIGLNGLTAKVEGAPSNWNIQVNTPTILAGSGSNIVSYTITAPNDSPITQDTFDIKLTSTEGVKASLPVSVNLERIIPRLVASTNVVSSGMLRENQTLVEFNLKNEGGAVAEDIEVLLPDAPWLKLASPTKINSLAPGESAKVSVLLTPDANLPLTEYKGNFFFDAAGNDGDLSLPFNFRAVSEAVGNIRINTSDELTFFAEGAPKLANAKVTLRDYFSNEVIATVVTDSTGFINLSNIKEGFYNLDVTADKHDTYRQVIQLDAGETEDVNAFLSRQTVRYIWTVTPTEIQDKYNISVESVFETDVPVPTLVIDPPLIDLEDLTIIGQVTQIDMTLTNQGLIAANDVKLDFGDHPFYKIEPLLNDIGTLGAKSSITVPVKITRIADFDTLSTNSVELATLATPSIPCDIPSVTTYTYKCGITNILKGTTIAVINVEGNCPGGNFTPIGNNGNGNGINYTPVIIVSNGNCDPCKANLERILFNCGNAVRICVTKSNPILACVSYVGFCAAGLYLGPSIRNIVSCLTDWIGCIPGAGVALCVYKAGLCLVDIITCGRISTPINSSSFENSLLQFPNFQISSTSSAYTPFLEQVKKYQERLQTVVDFFNNFFGDSVWLQGDDEEKLSNWLTSFQKTIVESTEDGFKISINERNFLLNLPLPEKVTGNDVNKFIDRWNRSIDYWSSSILNLRDIPEGYSEDFIAIDVLSTAATAVGKAIEQTQSEGYSNISDGIINTLDELQQALQGENSGVCARVRISIDQEAVMTRSAFLGDLEIENGNATSLTNLTVTLQVKDAQGNIVNDLFGITTPILKNINAVDGTGILTGDDPNTPQNEGIGSAQWTFIPTNLAAPEVPTQYSIGGSLSYTENGAVVTVPLLSTPITVYPQAELYLNYFQSRNVYGDDPFTDAVEPSIPFNLGVLVENKGKGDTKDLTITSAQPKIIENEKGLLIDFQILGSQVNGEDISPSLKVDFGNIKAGETAVANWLLKSTLQGKFIEYKATFEHVNSLGKPELSLIKDVQVHELIRQVRANDDNLPDFLVNDVFDAKFDPDTLYFSSGGTAPVKTVANATTDGVATFDDLTVQVNATVEAGWTYLRLQDPGDGLFQIKKVLRADGTEVRLDNVWITDRTFPATGRPIFENILNLLDNNPTAGNQTYTITYSTGDQTPPKVREIVDVDPDPRNTPINTIDVVFTEPIKTASFDASDITLTLDGTTINTSNLSISPVNANTYRIGNLAGITGNVGQYQLNVNAAGVQDFEGLAGVGIVNESWVFTGDRPAVASVTGFASNKLKAPITQPITVTFTEAINPSSFDFNDLFLNRDGGGDLIKNTVTITQIDASTYQISNLGDLTSTDGAYTFLVNARGVTDLDGNTGVGAKGFTWTLDSNAPSLTSITDVTSPRNTKVSNLDIAFSKPIDPATFDLNDLILTTDGTTNLITNSASLTKLTDTTYRLKGLTASQTTDGTYTLAIAGSGIKDSAGNTVTNSLSQNWTLDTTAPNAPTNIQATANLAPSIASLSVNTATSLGVLNEFGQIRVNSTNLIITGSLAETGLNVYVKDKTLNQSLGQATVNGTNFNSQVQLSGSGARDLEIQVVDAAGNTTTSPLSLFADITPPTLVKFTNIPQTPVTNPINAVEVEFSEIINLSTFDYQDITLTRDGGSNLITNAVTIEYLSGNTYRINGLGSLTQALGNYTLQVNTPGLQDQAGNQGIEPKNATFTIQSPSTPGVTISQSNGSTNVTEGGATDSYTVVLRTQPTANVTINLAIGNQIATDKTTLTFTTANWNVAQTITVTAIDDKITEGTQTNTITHTTSSSDSNYNSLTIPTVNVGIQDNDAEVRGIIWNDINGNGVRDNSEPTLSGWKVYLDSNNNNLLDTGEISTTSDSQGAYTFNDLRPNTYAIAQIVQDGYKQTYPVINVSTTASTEEIFTPSDILSTSGNTQNTSATHLINLDAFQSDPRFANIKGQGYSTVIIDTGINLDNPLFGADSDRNGIADKIIYDFDFADQDTDASDKNGHGSNIASIAASVASEANIIALKVFKDNGSGYFSDLEAALQWVNQNAQKYNIASVNLSLGDGQNWNTGNPRYGIGDELAAIASKNIIIAAAAGNSFYQFNSNPGLAYPAADPNTISVGAVWADNFGTNKSFSGGAIDYTTSADQIASFSQRSADQLGVFAPGIFITGANATGGTQSMGGTSQATPFISGLAVLAQQIAQEKLSRKLTLGEFRTLLDNTSIVINDGDNENDNVANTGKNFPRVNTLALAEGILGLGSQAPNPNTSDPNANSGNDPLYLPTVKLTQTVTLTSGQIATDINFGNQLLNNPPTLTNAIADQNATEDSAFTFTIPVNTFTDIDAGDVLTYSATLENGNALPSWITFNATERSFSGTPTNNEVGSLNLKVTATDSSGTSASDIFALTVANTNDAPVLSNAIADQNALEDSAFNFTIPINTFTDIDAVDVLTYSTTLENGNALPTWLTFNPTTRTFSGTPTNDNVGSLNVKVTATDKAGANVSDIFAIAVENLNDAPIVSNAIADQTTKQGDAFNFQIPINTFTDIDAGDVLTYSATLENGNALPSWLSFNSATRTFSGTPNNDNVGSLNVKVTAIDKAGANVSDIFAITIANTITANNGIISGTVGNDILIAGLNTDFIGQNNIIFTGAGNDEVDLAFTPFAKNNRVDLGSDNDSIFVSNGDRAFGGDGNDIFDARDGRGSNRMSGGAGNDTFFLGFGDRALGGDGDDKFFVGTGGGNLLSGGAGADHFWIFGSEFPASANTIIDFQIGTDVIGFQGAGVGFGIANLTLSGNNIALKSDPTKILATLTGIDTTSLTASNFVFI